MTDERPLHRFALRVYYEDTDFSGVVYHANYLKFLERGRTEYLRELGISQTGLFDGSSGPPIGFAVTRISIAFLASARMDDWLQVETRRTKLGGASVRLEQEIWRGADRLVEADVTVAALSMGRVVRIPAELARKLAR